MKKFILVIAMLSLYALTLVSFADSSSEFVTITTTSAPVTTTSTTVETDDVEMSKVGFETIRGFVISYDNQTLTLRVDDKDYPVTIFDRDNQISKDYPFIKKLDFIEVTAEYGESTYYLSEITKFSPIMDSIGPMPVIREAITLIYDDKEIISDVNAQLVDGTMMVPLRSVLEAMGYEVSWDGSTRTVEMKKGAIWTSVKIDENAYFKNRMAARPLSKAPIIIDGRTLVPAEFFVEVIGKTINVENGNITFSDLEPVTHSGFIKKMDYDETGTMTLVLVENMADEGFETQVIVHTSNAYTYIQNEIVIGDKVIVASPMMMTASMPPQTSAYLVYKVQ